jgi:flagellar P-ring protein FlgI
MSRYLRIILIVVGAYFSFSPLMAKSYIEEYFSVRNEISERMEPYRQKTFFGREVKIANLVDMYGQEKIKLTGFGIVTGLNGTGDASAAAKKMILNVAEKQGIRIDLGDLGGASIALVSLSAEVNPQDRLFDVAIKSISDSKSLQNGFLEASTLTPIGSNDVLAVVSGPIALGGRFFGASGGEGGGDTSVTSGHPTIGYVISGGEMLEELPVERLRDGKVILYLKHPDERTSTNMAESINEVFEDMEIIASPINSSKVEVLIPELFHGDNGSGRLTRLIADIGDLPVTPYQKARITIDQGAGVIAITEGVKMESGSIAVAGLTVKGFFRDAGGDETRFNRG